MPFTLAHPAAVLPLRRLPYLATIPLVLGSLTPDFASAIPRGIFHSYFLPHSHSLRGTLLLDLPSGYMLLLVLVALRTQLTAPLWEPHRSFLRAAFAQFVGLKYWWLIAIPSLLLGSWTHVLWDSFTHEDRWMVRNLPVLQQALAPENDHPMQIYHVLQYVCSIIGLVIVAAWYFLALRQSGLTGTGHKWRKYTLAALAAGAMIIGAVKALHAPVGISTYRMLAIVLSTAMAVFAVLYLLTGIAIAVKTGRRSD